MNFNKTTLVISNFRPLITKIRLINKKKKLYSASLLKLRPPPLHETYSKIILEFMLNPRLYIGVPILTFRNHYYYYLKNNQFFPQVGISQKHPCTTKKFDAPLKAILINLVDYGRSRFTSTNSSFLFLCRDVIFFDGFKYTNYNLLKIAVMYDLGQ